MKKSFFGLSAAFPLSPGFQRLPVAQGSEPGPIGMAHTNRGPPDPASGSLRIVLTSLPRLLLKHGKVS